MCAFFSDTSSILRGIRRWIECESPSNDIHALRSMANLILADAAAWGLQCHMRDLGEAQAPLLYITNREPNDERSGVMVLAHYDTVHPIGTLKKNPCRVEGDRFYGPGSYDMKAGAWLALNAMGQVAQHGHSRLPVDFLIVPDEEIGSYTSREHIESHCRNSQYVLVCEPARAEGGRCVTARKGTGFIYLHTHGRAAHAGVQHDKGRNAIQEMAHHVLALQAMTDYERGITVSVGTIQGGTAINVVPEHCRIACDFRIPDAQSGDALRAKVEALTSEDSAVELKTEFVLNRPPMPRTKGNVDLWKRARVFAQEVGLELDEAPMTGGGSDANFAAALGVPTLDGLGADGDGAHTLQEHVLISSLPQRLSFWREILQGLD